MTPNQIKRLRKEMGLNREAMARRIGVTVQTIFRWETGRSSPEAKSIRRLKALAYRNVGMMMSLSLRRRKLCVGPYQE